MIGVVIHRLVGYGPLGSVTFLLGVWKETIADVSSLLTSAVFLIEQAIKISCIFLSLCLQMTVIKSRVRMNKTCVNLMMEYAHVKMIYNLITNLSA